MGSTSNGTHVGEDVLREAFCRDVEAFSHLLRRDRNEKPENCPKINSSLCAVLYDSSTCSAGSWELSVRDGAQKSSTTGPPTGNTGTTPTLWESGAGARSQDGPGVVLTEIASL